MSKLPHAQSPVGLLVLCLLFVLATVSARASGDDWRPVEPAELALKTPVVEKDADAEALFWEVRVDDSDESDLVFNNYIRIKIFTERGRESQSKIDIVPFRANARIKDVSGRTIKPDGTIIELQKEDVFEKTVVKANGLKFKTKTFAMPGVEPGAIIEYRWREVYPNSSANYKRLYFQRDIPVESVKYYIKPSGAFDFSSLRFQSFGMENPPSFVKDKNGFYSATVTNVPAYRAEPHMPPEDEVHRWILLYYANRLTALIPELFWAELGKGVYDVYKNDIKPNDEVKQKAAALTAGATTNEQKLAQLYDFCRTQIKNLSSDTSGLTEEERAKLKPNKSPAETLKRGQGTSADIRNLFAALAIAAGFDARLALTADRNDVFFNRGFADPYFMVFDGLRCIAVKDGDDWRFYNPAQTYLPAGMLEWQAEMQDVLISDPKGSVWARTPLSAPDKSLEKRTAKLKLSEDGTLEGDVKIEYTGQTGAIKKQYNDDDSPAQREETLRNMVKAQMSTAEISDIKIENVEDPNKPFTYEYHVRVSGYAQRTGKRLFLQPAFFERGRRPLFTAAERRYEVYFDYPWSEQDYVEIELPAGFALDNADQPEPFSAGDISKYEVHIGVTQDKHTLVYRRSFYFGNERSLLLPVKSYPQLKLVFDELHKRDEHTITLKQDATVASAPTTSN
jgi:Domain of Unknown Function with PDB structure (DUF3857)/Transglutaminase-like superfamily